MQGCALRYIAKVERLEDRGLLGDGLGRRLITLLIFISTAGAARSAETFAVPHDVSAVLKKSCTDCHGADVVEGDVRLDEWASLSQDARLDLLNKVQEQLYFGQMPPKDAEQPSARERSQLADWAARELQRFKASKLETKLQKPEYGNYVDHDRLFSGEFRDLPGFTYDRRWLISEYIFNAKFQRLLENTTRATRHGKAITVLGGNRIQNLSLTNPFLLPNRSGVRCYANEDLTGGHLSSMLTNAQATSEYITDFLVKKKNGKYLPAVNRIMALEDGAL